MTDAYDRDRILRVVRMLEPDFNGDGATTLAIAMELGIPDPLMPDERRQLENAIAGSGCRARVWRDSERAPMEPHGWYPPPRKLSDPESPIENLTALLGSSLGRGSPIETRLGQIVDALRGRDRPRPHAGACEECEQLGWFCSTSDQYGESIERCDNCAAFADDDAAQAHARAVVADVALHGKADWTLAQLEIIADVGAFLLGADS